MTASLSYFNLLSLEKETAQGLMTINRPATCAVGDVRPNLSTFLCKEKGSPVLQPNPLIEAQRNRIEVARAISEALEAGKKGDYAAGQRVLEAAKAKVASSKAASAASASMMNELGAIRYVSLLVVLRPHH